MSQPKKTLEFYIQKATTIHAGRFLYDQWTELGQYHDKIPITCVHHGVFWSTLANHITNASGCPTCKNIARSRGFNSTPSDIWLQRCVEVHGTTYLYEFPPDWSNADTDKVIITCQVHGQFLQTLADHVRKKAGCPKCAISLRSATCTERYGTSTYSQSQISAETLGLLQDAEWLHDQHVVQEKSFIQIASDLGISDGTVGRHMHAAGITAVRYPKSSGELEVFTFIKELGLEAIGSDRSLIGPLELDIYVPSSFVAIEYCGLYWHSSKHKTSQYHATKFQKAAAVGVQLITLFEDEWRNRPEAVKLALKSKLGMDKSKAIYARNLHIDLVSPTTCKAFFDQFHVQGYGPMSTAVGLWNGSTLIACLGLKKINQSGAYLISRFATSAKCPGGFSKLLAWVKNNLDWSMLETFADNRWSTGALYETTGFTLVSTVPPDYYWTDGTVRHHKFGFRHKHLATKLKTYDPELTEVQNCKANRLYQIFDCGKKKYVLHNPLFVAPTPPDQVQ